MNLEERIKHAMVDVHDFPSPGIVFKDITPLFQDPSLLNDLVDAMVEAYKDQRIDAIVGLESRGFLLAVPLSMRLGIPFIMVRKKGKLPRECHSISYDLEYGSSTIEMHKDALQPGSRVLIHDDVLATGGTAEAAAKLVQQAGAEVAMFQFIVELSFLKGMDRMLPYTSRVTTFARF
jgi:adenine phosphoribosyltransferase